MLTGRNVLTVLIRSSGPFFLILILCSSLASCEENVVNIGVMVRSDSIHTMDKWNLTVDHLNAEIDTHVFKLVPMEFNNFSKIKANEIDFIICNPWMYVETENKYGITRIATQKNIWEGKPYTMHGAVFISLANRTDINTFEDLRDRSFMYVDNASFASYLITLHELQQLDVKQNQFGKVSFGGNSSSIVFSVRDGNVDAGAIRTGTLEYLNAEGLIDMDDFKVLHEQHPGNFPFLLSSQLYPEWAFARTNSVPDELVEEVVIALLNMPDEEGGWTVPQDYHQVHDLMRDLRIGPYENYGKMSTNEIINKYIFLFLMILMFSFVIVLTTTYVDSVNHQHKEELIKREKAENALMESEDKFAKISTSAQDAIIMIDNKGMITFWNRAAEKMFNYTKEEVMGKDLHELIAPAEYRNSYKQGLARFMTEGKGHAIGTIISLKARKKTGDEFPVELSLSSFVLRDGTWNAAGIIRDITYRKKAEEALIDATSTAEAANRTKSEFLANMSHELRTPLNSIIGFSDMLLEGTVGDLNEKQTKYIKNVSTSGRHLLTVINDILDLSKVDSGRMKILYEKFTINEVLDDVKNTLAHFAISRSITLNFETEPGLREIYADKLKLKQILYNLVSNAIKFTPEKGSVYISASARSDMLHVEVRDTGIGINADDQKKLFTAFTQLDSAYSRKYQGTGLGLVLVKKFVEMHEGSVWVESETGKGSNFMFEIPFQKHI